MSSDRKIKRTRERGSRRTGEVAAPSPGKRRSETRAGRGYRPLGDEMGWVGMSREPTRPFPWFKVPTAVLLICCFSLLAAFMAHPLFEVRSVSVRGQQLASPEDIVAAAGIHDRSVFQVHPLLAAAKIQSRIASVAQAAVEVRLPNEVAVEVWEREIATVWITGGKSYLVDSGGLIVGPGEILGPRVLIEDLANVPRDAGDRVPAEILSMVTGLHRLMPEVDEYTYSQQHGVSILTVEGWPVYFGYKGDPALKASLLRALTSDFERRGIRPQYVDLRIDESPAYR